MIPKLLCLALVLLEVVATAQSPEHSSEMGDPALLRNLTDIKWEKALPDLGENSPEISILHVNPETHSTQLLIRLPKNFHVPKHWHSANETHTIISGSCIFQCGGKKNELGVGGFNYMPAKMLHEAWSTDAGCLLFITVDGAWDVNWVDGPPTPEQVKEPAPK